MELDRSDFDYWAVISKQWDQLHGLFTLAELLVTCNIVILLWIYSGITQHQCIFSLHVMHFAGRKKTHKGGHRHFTSEDDLAREQEKARKEREWRVMLIVMLSLQHCISNISWCCLSYTTEMFSFDLQQLWCASSNLYYHTVSDSVGLFAVLTIYLGLKLMSRPASELDFLVKWVWKIASEW